MCASVMDVDGDQVLLILNHQHGWGLPLLVNGTTLLVQGEATQSPCVLVLVVSIRQDSGANQQRKAPNDADTLSTNADNSSISTPNLL